MQPFDPLARLPSAPEPWESSGPPAPRTGSPYHMTEMIQAEPALAVRILDRLADPAGPAARLATAIRTAATATRPILVVGCGTSEHGAIAIADILREAARASGLPAGLGEVGTPTAAQAFEAALEPGLGGPGALVIGVSHEGGTWATNRALSSARDAGSTVAIVTAAGESPGAELAGIVISTDEMDQSWCHTIGYVSPILAGFAVAAHLTGSAVDARAVSSLLAAGLRDDATADIESLAEGFDGIDRLIVLGSGADRAAARELTLKSEEGAHLPGAMRDLETMLHGHLAATDGATGLVLILTDRSARGARTARALGVLRACREIGIRVGLIVSEVVAAEIEPGLSPAGRILVPDAPELPATVAALVGSAIPLQRLSLELAIRRGVDPDPIRRDDARYMAAADAAG
jgi:glucosamine--fructose-6-phosphate aminotransferase (isomerizing)